METARRRLQCMNRKSNEVYRSAENAFGKQVQLCALNDICSFRTGHVSRNIFSNCPRPMGLCPQVLRRSAQGSRQ